MSPIVSPAASPNRALSIAICGGGIGGLAAALALHNRGFHPVVFEKAMPEALREEGLFLTLAPNGINALRGVALEDTVLAAGLRTDGLAIHNERGRRLTVVDYARHAANYGAASVTIRRSVLAGILLDTATAAGIPVHHGHGVDTATEGPDGVDLSFAGTTRRYDLVIAADGLRSRLRRQLFPDFPEPVYSGQIGTGGFTDVPSVSPTDGLMNMTFGRKAFFGYIKAPGQPVYWFNSYPAPESEAAPVRDAEANAARLRAMHADDPLDNAAILAAAGPVNAHYPIYDMPELPRWHSKRVVLLGDAAHAVAPHSGQGASMALEDALVLAACLAEEQHPEAAFARFENLRRARVQRAIELGRFSGSQKLAQSWWQLKLRDLILPLVMPMGARMQAKLYAYRADRDPLALPQQ